MQTAAIKRQGANAPKHQSTSAQSARPCQFTQRIGSTVFEVRVLFDTAKSESLEDKILRLLRRDLELGLGGVSENEGDERNNWKKHGEKANAALKCGENGEKANTALKHGEQARKLNTPLNNSAKGAIITLPQADTHPVNINSICADTFSTNKSIYGDKGNGCRTEVHYEHQ